MVHIVAFTNKFPLEIIFTTGKIFYKTIHPGRVSVITSYGFIENKSWYNIQNFWIENINLIHII